jgi:medium-chain acyl-[acyl-carrier-protein] hydrolase
MSAILTYTYKISSYHTDDSGHLFIYQLFNFLQDAAHNHADGGGYGQKQLVDHDLFWVLSRLTIEISSLPKHGDEISLSTWVKSIRGAISEREFSISHNGQILINASSLWFSVAGESHKPARLQEKYSDMMILNNTYATTSGSEKVVGEGSQRTKSEGAHVTARYSDIDMVDHVNNATYVRWMMDEIPRTYQQKKSIKKLSINYLGECFMGDELKVNHSKEREILLDHEVLNQSSNIVICRAQSEWHK